MILIYVSKKKKKNLALPKKKRSVTPFFFQFCFLLSDLFLSLFFNKLFLIALTPSIRPVHSPHIIPLIYMLSTCKSCEYKHTHCLYIHHSVILLHICIKKKAEKCNTGNTEVKIWMANDPRVQIIAAAHLGLSDQHVLLSWLPRDIYISSFSMFMFNIDLLLSL